MKVGKLLKVLVVASAVIGATSAMAGITDTKHNLAAGSGNTITSVYEDQLCIFCHTPHGADADYAGAPLWNKEAGGTMTYQMYGATIYGTVATDALDNNVTEPNSPSRVCLSCHDGVSAINSIVNTGGSGAIANFYAAISGQPDNNTTAFHMPWNQITNIGDTNSSLPDTVNLTNDHPISVKYNVNAASLRATSTGLNTAWGGAAVEWTVSGIAYTDDSKTIADILRSDRVECVSCHDPHLSNVTFLRTPSNAGSKLCLTCHNK